MRIPSALGKLSQEDYSTFKTCLGYIANIRPSRKTYIRNLKAETKNCKEKRITLSTTQISGCSGWVTPQCSPNTIRQECSCWALFRRIPYTLVTFVSFCEPYVLSQIFLLSLWILALAVPAFYAEDVDTEYDILASYVAEHDLVLLILLPSKC